MRLYILWMNRNYFQDQKKRKEFYAVTLEAIRKDLVLYWFFSFRELEKIKNILALALSAYHNIVYYQ